MKLLKLFLICFLSLFLTTNSKAGAWTLKKGQLWVKSSVLYQKTGEVYYSRNVPCTLPSQCRTGQRVPFFRGAESRFKALFFDFGYGVTDRLELIFQVPYFDVDFADAVESLQSKGVGDIRFGARFRLLSKPIVPTLKIVAKAPTGFFNKSAFVVPIGDGQWDLEFSGQFGRSLWPIPLYLNLDLGYRFRFAPDPTTSSRDPGDEFFFRGEGGYSVSKNVLFKIAVSGTYGSNFDEDNFTILDSQREILYAEPGIYVRIQESFAIESSILFSLSGKNFTAGRVFNLGASYTFSVLK